MDYGERFLIEDIVQDAFEKMLDLINRYDPEIAGFTYYTNRMLKQHIKAYIRKEANYIKKTPILLNGENTRDFLFGQKNSLFNQFIGEEILQQIKDTLQKYAARARSKTTKSVCNDFFFGNKSCQEVADECGVSYHAVYETIHRAKCKIADILKHNSNCGYKATLETSNIWTLKKKNRDYLNTYIVKAYCKSCGHQWVYNSEHINKCSKCRNTSWHVKKEYVKLFS